MTKDEFRKIIEESVKKIASSLPKRRTRPYTKREARDLFQVTYPTLDSWEKKGYLVRVKIGGRVYYTAESVEKRQFER